MAHSFPMKLESTHTSSSSHYNPDAFIFIPKVEENDGTTKNNRIGLVDVILLQQNQNDKEYLSNIEVLMTKENEVILSSLIHTLKHMGFSLEGAMIFYYDFQSDFFVYCGNDPLSTNIYIPIQGKKSKPIMIKYRKPQHLLPPSSPQPHLKFAEESKSDPSILSLPLPPSKKRIKERVIGDVIEKVIKWRQLHEGRELNGKRIQMPLDVAAQKVGVSKKTLDDYMFQIKLGKKYNFNFKDHENDKIGILRSFVKKHRLLEKEGTMTSDLETDEMRSFSKAEEENYNRECICNNCRRSSSPSCKNEVNKEFDFLDYFLSDSLKGDKKKMFDDNYYPKPQETF